MIDNTHLSKLIGQGLNSLELHNITEPLLNYLLLLDKWNKTYNLTAIRDVNEMVAKHLLDSLAILPWIQGLRIIDVGTGAGLPGIPLAIARPDIKVTLLDSNGKKTRFLQEVQRNLGLKNLEIVQFRVEDYHPSLGFDTVLSRAFSSLQQMVDKTEHLLAPSGQWLAMKGHYIEAECLALKKSFTVEQYTVQGILGARCCILIK
jgi:16S rRNA (guanine527-N7)-methyltransferase